MESKSKQSTPNNPKEEQKENTNSKKRKAEHPTVIQQGDAKKLKLDDQYYVKDTLLVLVAGGDKPSKKIASFDLDHTLIKPKSNAKFGQTPSDWVLLYGNVKSKLKELNQDGYRIVIFTNQGGVEQGHTTFDQLRKKFGLIQADLGIPMTFLAATHSDIYRKPALGMWDHFNRELNRNISLDMTDSFYCGDAAGRPKSGTRGKDFSDSDIKFAINSNIPFKLPEEVFLDQKTARNEIPKNFLTALDKKPEPKQTKLTLTKEESKKSSKSEKNGSVAAKSEPSEKYTSDKQEIILFCGAPGSGKSTFWKNHLSSYERVNNDTLKTPEKCMKVCEAAVIAGKSVVIDNTNKTKEQRVRYTAIAKKYNIGLRCFVFDVPKDTCLHNNTQRETNKHHTHLSKKISKIPIHDFFKNVEKPDKSEGFEEIKTIKFVPVFENDDDKKAYAMLT